MTRSNDFAFTTLAQRMAFVGGGNMAQAILGGLLQGGLVPAAHLCVIEPNPSVAEHLRAQFGVPVHEDIRADNTQSDTPSPPGSSSSSSLRACDLVIWAVKPQVFEQAAAPVAPWVRGALHLSVMAGIGVDALSRQLQTRRIVRAMPNTPALVGEGMTGLFAAEAVDAAGRACVEAVMCPTGELQWVEQESDLDAVTALSGSGPAYVFYFLEVMVNTGVQMGLREAVARRLAVQTFLGGASLAAQSTDALSTLRERVTSPGGTTEAALLSLQQSGVAAAFEKALYAARDRAVELGRPLA